MPTDDDFEDDRPRRPRNSRDRDDDEPPRRRRRDEDDYDDEPRRRDQKPHRAVMILVFGILSLVCCPIVFSLLAIFMGQADLKEMDAGRMDPSGRGMTKAGVIIGIIGLVLMVFWIILRFTVFAGNAVMQR